MASSFDDGVVKESISDPSLLVDIRQLAEPEFEDGLATVIISEAPFQSEAQKYKSALLGRISFLPKADRLSFIDLKEKLSIAWSLSTGWDLIFLGKGYYVIKFASEIIRRRIWAEGSWNLHPGIFRVSNWEPDFNPFTQYSLKTKVWIRLFLSVEYWHPRNLLEIAKGVGHPLCIDRATTNKTNGQYARVLVEVDLNEVLTTDILIRRPGYSFWVKVFYERLPEKCDRCNSIGHSLEKCKKKKRMGEDDQSIPSKQINIVDFSNKRQKQKIKQKQPETFHHTPGVRNLDAKMASSSHPVFAEASNHLNSASFSTLFNKQSDPVGLDLSANDEVRSEVWSGIESSGTVGEEQVEILTESKRPTYAQILSAKTIKIPSTMEVRKVVAASSMAQQADEAVVVLPQAIGNSVTKAYVLQSEEVKDPKSDALTKEINEKRLQIERDLQLIAEGRKHTLMTPPHQPVGKPTSEIMETEMEELVTIKSRSFKHLSNKKKHMRNKIKVSLSKNKHNYSLRGVSLQAKRC